MSALTLPVTIGENIVEQRPITRVGPQGLLCREGTYDDTIAKSAPREYASLPVQGRVVLDVGGNVGAFARYAALAGAKMVVTIEPEESNFNCLLANTAGLPNVMAIRGCLGLEAGECDIWLSAGGRNPGNTSQTQRRGRFAQRVPVVALADIMTRFRPESVKLDCEGAEYVIGRAAVMPEYVRDVVAEVHISGFGAERAQSFCQEYTDAGWRTVREPKVTPTLWHTLGGWTR